MTSVLTVVGCLLFVVLLNYIDWRFPVKRYKSTKGISFRDDTSPRADGQPLAGGLNKNYIDISEED